MSYADNLRWRQKYPEKRAAERKRYYDKTRNASNSGKEWTSEELELLDSFEGTDTQLGEKLGRGVQAIQIRRTKLRKAEREEAARHE